MVKHIAIAHDYCISAGIRCQQKKRHPVKGKKQSWMPKDGSAEGATSTDADIISITIGLVNNKKRAPAASRCPYERSTLGIYPKHIVAKVGIAVNKKSALRCKKKQRPAVITSS